MSTYSRIALVSSWLVLIFLMLVGCEASSAGGAGRGTPGRYPPLTAPWVAASDGVGLGAALAQCVMGDPEAENFVREGKYVTGPQTYFAYSAFSDYISDTQPIGPLNGSGWRYRQTVRYGVTVP